MAMGLGLWERNWGGGIELFEGEYSLWKEVIGLWEG